jgi:hypothetical protein
MATLSLADISYNIGIFRPAETHDVHRPCRCRSLKSVLSSEPSPRGIRGAEPIAGKRAFSRGRHRFPFGGTKPPGSAFAPGLTSRRLTSRRLTSRRLASTKLASTSLASTANACATDGRSPRGDRPPDVAPRRGEFCRPRPRRGRMRSRRNKATRTEAQRIQRARPGSATALAADEHVTAGARATGKSAEQSQAARSAGAQFRRNKPNRRCRRNKPTDRPEGERERGPQRRRHARAVAARAGGTAALPTATSSI